MGARPSAHVAARRAPPVAGGREPGCGPRRAAAVPFGDGFFDLFRRTGLPPGPGTMTPRGLGLLKSERDQGGSARWLSGRMGSLPCIQISELGRLFLDYGGAKFYRFDLFSRSERSRVLESWTRFTGSAGVFFFFFYRKIVRFV